MFRGGARRESETAALSVLSQDQAGKSGTTIATTTTRMESTWENTRSTLEGAREDSNPGNREVLLLFALASYTGIQSIASKSSYQGTIGTAVILYVVR